MGERENQFPFAISHSLYPISLCGFDSGSAFQAAGSDLACRLPSLSLTRSLNLKVYLQITLFGRRRSGFSRVNVTLNVFKKVFMAHKRTIVLLAAVAAFSCAP